MLVKAKTTISALKRSILGLSLCTSLTVGSTAAYSWFSNNKEVTAKGMQINAKSSDLDIYDYYVYKRSGTDSARVVDKDQPLTMSEYDTIFTDKNVNTPIIIKALLGVYPKDFSEFYISVSCDDQFTDSDGKLVNILSNIAKIGTMPGDATLNSYDSVSDANEIYDYVSANVNNDSCFVSYTKVSGKEDITLNSKDEELVLEIENYNANSIVDGRLAIYIKLDYEDALIKKYLDSHDIIVDASGGQDDQDQISFESDISCFTFYSSKEEDK